MRHNWKLLPEGTAVTLVTADGLVDYTIGDDVNYSDPSIAGTLVTGVRVTIEVTLDRPRYLPDGVMFNVDMQKEIVDVIAT